MRDSVKMVGAALVGVVLGVALMGGKRTVEVPGLLELYEGRVLVGTGCEGGDLRNGVAIAFEEDTMPLCERIDVHIVE